MLQTFLLGILIGFLLWIPDFILAWIIPTIKVAFNPFEFGALMGVGILLAFTRSRIFVYVTLGFLWIMLMIQLNHQGYFGLPISPVDISRLIEDSRDIVETGSKAFFYLWPVTAILTINYLLIAALVKRCKFSVPFIPLIILALFYNNTSRLWKHEIARYLVNPTDHSIRKGLNCFNMWLIGVISRKTVDISHQYEPYQVHFQPVNEPKTIILIMGESATYRHMSLYGYKRSTTPKLEKRKNDTNFAYAKGISSSVSTFASLSLFFNTMREPGHLAIINKKMANLWYIAKKQGFKTILISAQEAKLIHNCGAEHNDVLISNESPEGIIFKHHGDFGLLKLLKKHKLGEKNLIVLHQAVLHSPFEIHYAKYPQFNVYKTPGGDRFQQSVDTYDNAMPLTDQIWDEIIEYAKELKGEVTVVFTSDHGELLGEHGLLGHNLLKIETAQVGMWCYSSNRNNTAWFRQKPYRSHYDLSKWIASQMGATIHNPNEKEGITFVHARNLYENYRYLKINHAKNLKLEGEFVVDGYLPPQEVLYQN